MKFSLHVYTTQQPYFCLLLKFFCKLGTIMSPLGENNFVFYGSDFNPGSFLRTPCGFTHCFIFIEFTSIKNQMTWDLIQYVYNCVFSLRVFTACFHYVNTVHDLRQNLRQNCRHFRQLYQQKKSTKISFSANKIYYIYWFLWGKKRLQIYKMSKLQISTCDEDLY